MPDTPDLIMELNDFANHCGYVFNACMQDGIIANNGYNCSHPDQDETVEDDSGESVGSVSYTHLTLPTNSRV